MKKELFISLTLALAIVAGCSTVPKSKKSRIILSAEVQEAISVFKQKDPMIQMFFNNSYGYAVLPKVFKGAWWLGGGYGNGEVYEQDKMVGYCGMSQATWGFSFGGKFIREVIFFREKKDFDKFRLGEYTFSAQVTGVVLTAGAAAKADYKDGMAVFVVPDKGLMVDASLGGQKFNYVPVSVLE